MNVRELIEILASLPPVARVVVDDVEGVFDDVGFAKAVAIRGNANQDAHYYGPHLADDLQPWETAACIGAARTRGARLTVADMEADKARGIW
ncbi:hypothetical protein U5817_12180 [Aromatoleum evansii]|uniref:Uncharacterized protein n=1 Tax=Aromatoleum evansii TaxID=59406 RepID=A0ABZ1ASH0_AROEV|nr:hypothetical protein [Aromatoleum toluclasticum]MBD5803224.1 hypothetical protein [Azoarcus sp. Aa7]WRL48773.1 hypothetical protein U5817_12180 [Aromatoleum evansii]